MSSFETRKSNIWWDQVLERQYMYPASIQREKENQSNTQMPTKKVRLHNDFGTDIILQLRLRLRCTNNPNDNTKTSIPQRLRNDLELSVKVITAIQRVWLNKLTGTNIPTTRKDCVM